MRDKILSQDATIAKTSNQYFINIPILNMPNNQDFSSQTCSSVEDAISRIIEGYPSIKRFKSKIVLWLIYYLLRQSQLKK